MVDRRLNVRVPADLHRQLRIHAASTGRPIQLIVVTLLRRAVSEWTQQEIARRPQEEESHEKAAGVSVS